MAALVFSRSEVSIFLLTAEGGVDPLAGFGDDPLIPEGIAQGHIAPEPVGEFLPAEFTLAVGACPRAVLELAPLGQFGQASGESVSHGFELVAEPPMGRDASRGQLHEWVRQQGRAARGGYLRGAGSRRRLGGSHGSGSLLGMHHQRSNHAYAEQQRPEWQATAGQWSHLDIYGDRRASDQAGCKEAIRHSPGRSLPAWPVTPRRQA